MSIQVLHITDTHCAFDDRIFYKELCSLAKKYDCYQLIISNEDNQLRDMGGKVLKIGSYNNVHCMAMTFFGRNTFFTKCIRKFLPFLYKYYKYIKLENKILKKLSKEEISPRIIHYHDLTLSKTINKLRKKYNCNVIFDCHEFYFSYPFDSGLNKSTLKKAENEILLLKDAVEEADYVISVTKNLDALIALMRKDEKHSVIYNSSIIPIDISDKSIDKNKKIVLVHEGSLGFDRGLKLMLEMFSDNFILDNFKLKIVGNIKGKEKEYFDKKVRELNITNENIECTGWVSYEELYKYLNGDVGIIFFDTTFNAYFSMPNRLFNYHCAGLPVICTHCADLSDMIEFTKTGIVFERNIESLKSALYQIKNNYDYYYRNIKENVNLYHWSKDEQNLFSIYEKVLN